MGAHHGLVDALDPEPDPFDSVELGGGEHDLGEPQGFPQRAAGLGELRCEVDNGSVAGDLHPEQPGTRWECSGHAQRLLDLVGPAADHDLQGLGQRVLRRDLALGGTETFGSAARRGGDGPRPVDVHRVGRGSGLGCRGGCDVCRGGGERGFGRERGTRRGRSVVIAAGGEAQEHDEGSPPGPGGHGEPGA